MTVTIELNEPQIVQKVTNDNFGKFVATEWERLIRPYVPYKTGQLQQKVTISPFQIKYEQPYAHYMYTGVLYVDPVTGSPWGKFGSEKVPTMQNLTYRTDHNLYATDHWDQKAAKAGQLAKLYSSINKANNKKLF